MTPMAYVAVWYFNHYLLISHVHLEVFFKEKLKKNMFLFRKYLIILTNIMCRWRHDVCVWWWWGLCSLTKRPYAGEMCLAESLQNLTKYFYIRFFKIHLRNSPWQEHFFSMLMNCIYRLHKSHFTEFWSFLSDKWEESWNLDLFNFDFEDFFGLKRCWILRWVSLIWII